jgi:hypothetical protein
MRESVREFTDSRAPNAEVTGTSSEVQQCVASQGLQHRVDRPSTRCLHGVQRDTPGVEQSDCHSVTVNYYRYQVCIGAVGDLLCQVNRKRESDKRCPHQNIVVC